MIVWLKLNLLIKLIKAIKPKRELNKNIKYKTTKEKKVFLFFHFLNYAICLNFYFVGFNIYQQTIRGSQSVI